MLKRAKTLTHKNAKKIDFEACQDGVGQITTLVEETRQEIGNKNTVKVFSNAIYYVLKNKCISFDEFKDIYMGVASHKAKDSFYPPSKAAHKTISNDQEVEHFEKFHDRFAEIAKNHGKDVINFVMTCAHQNFLKSLGDEFFLENIEYFFEGWERSKKQA